MSMPSDPPLIERLTLTIPEAAQALGISRNSAYDAVKTGQLPCITIGRRRLVPRAALEKKLAEGMEKAR